MKINLFLVGLMALAIGLMSSDSFAQRGPGMMWRGSGGWGPGTQYNRMYDPKTVETISGEIIAVDRITPMKGMSGGVHMNVKTDKETISVQLGPSFYIENQDVKLQTKDKVEVKASDHRGGGEERRRSVEAA
jgi:hypothetical protein